MRNALEKMSELIESITHLQEDEAKFLSSYLQDISHDLMHFHQGHHPALLDFATLWDQFGSSSYSGFVHQLLTWTYENDEYHTVSRVCGFLYGSLPESEDVKQILLKGIWDTQKSNRLRERFFWCFNHQFNESATDFFSSKLSRFIQENGDNEDLMANIIDFIHWNMEKSRELDQVKEVIVAYLRDHAEVSGNIHSPSTKEILGIA